MTAMQPSCPASHPALCDVENEKEQKRVMVTVTDRASSSCYRYKSVAHNIFVSGKTANMTAIPKNIDIMHAAEVIMSLHSLVYQPELNTLRTLWVMVSKL